MINKEVIRDDQYKNTDNLQARISIHEKYTRLYPNLLDEIANRYPWGNSQRVLEYGCGTGVFWESAIPKLNTNSKVLLTDISEGMLNQTKKNITDSRFSFQVADVDHQTFDQKYDLILCHFMLYYSEDSLKTLQKLKNQLTPSGKLAVVTLGLEHMQRFDHEINKIIEEEKIKTDLTNQAIAKSFSEDTADKELNQVFTNVEKIVFEDFLDVTEVSSIIDYCKSTMRFSGLEDQIYQIFNKKITKEINENGKFVIEKRVVLYICQ